MAPRDAFRIRKMHRAVRPCARSLAKKEFAMKKAGMTLRTEWRTTEDGLTWAARTEQMRRASKLRNEVVVVVEDIVLAVEDDEMEDFHSAFEETEDGDVEMDDEMGEDYAEIDIGFDDEDMVENEEEEVFDEEDEDEEEMTFLPRHTPRYELRPRPYVDYKPRRQYYRDA